MSTLLLSLLHSLRFMIGSRASLRREIIGAVCTARFALSRALSAARRTLLIVRRRVEADERGRPFRDKTFPITFTCDDAEQIATTLLQLKSTALDGRPRRGSDNYASARSASVSSGSGQHRGESVYTAVVIALNTGMRETDIRTLKWQQLDFDTRTIVVGKSKTAAGTGRPIPMNDRLTLALRTWANWFPSRRPEHYVLSGTVRHAE